MDDMKIKMAVIFICVMIIVNGIFFGIVSCGKSTASSISQIETSTDIGANFPDNTNDEVKIKNASFAPKITRNEAITIARNHLQAGINYDTQNLPAEATVAFFSGHLQQKDRPLVNDVPVWIVVIKEVPFKGSAGPFPTPPNNPNFSFTAISQVSLAIDATTAQVLYGVNSSKIERFPAQ